MTMDHEEAKGLKQIWKVNSTRNSWVRAETEKQE